MKPETLRIFGVIAAGATVVLALAGADLNANGVPSGANPIASVGMGLAAIAFMLGARAP
jgi:hypothetical protein